MDVNNIIIKMDKEESKLPPSLKDFSPKYAYLYTKAALFLYNGGEWYRRNDYFNYPGKNWSRKMLKDISAQVINGLGGISENNPIKIKVNFLIVQFFKSEYYKNEVTNL